MQPAHTKEIKQLDLVATPLEVGLELGLSKHTVYRRFEKEPGVLIDESPEIVGTGRSAKNSKQRHRTMRIPRHVLDPGSKNGQ